MRPRRTSRPLLPGKGPLARVTPAAAFLNVLAVFVVAVLLRGPVGALILGALDLAVLILLAVTWTALRPAERILRVGVLLVLALVAVSMTR